MIHAGMDKLTRQFSWLSVAGFALGFYAAWVLQCLWNWFLVPATGIPRISFWLMYGLYLLVDLLVDHHRNELAAQMRSEVLGASIEACVPEERQEVLPQAWMLKE